MTGVAIVANLLAADAAISQVVAAASLKAGMLPQGVALPALLVREISLIEWLKLRRIGRVRWIARIQVTVRASTYQGQKDLIALVISACAGRSGDIGGGSNVSITNAGAGPDLIGDGGIFEQSQDFRVTFETTA